MRLKQEKKRIEENVECITMEKHKLLGYLIPPEIEKRVIQREREVMRNTLFRVEFGSFGDI